MGFKVCGAFGDVVRACLKRFVVFLAVRGCIPVWVAESLIRKWGLIHA